MGSQGAHTVFKRPDELAAAVVLYVTEYCGFCRMAEGLLRRKGIPFEAVDVTNSDEARSWLVERSGQRTVPQIFIKGNSIGGYTELAALERAGKLAALLAG
ncbi:glutaredoxin 3 [Nannocystis sp.]|uniref:glutaredoxin 3 n=1 Tax=Nannocystis sp. TaxID=1962667 RepID=UPI0024226293|nr:glutaredoxin 3 [Nannocystis sp.]MBK7824478.1 glutaredoxin 3 [Nannocystis sp.]MBK9753272.1 glutaredoxin 3 [Nannocystis sp.]